jgi:ribokinase
MTGQHAAVRYDVLVVGSANMDLVVSCRKFPEPGETAFAQDFGMYPGGKGANQAVACGRLGSRVAFVARMGDDLFRTNLLSSLESNGVDPRFVVTDPDRSTGVALITVDQSGQNEILVVSGSNMNLSPADVNDHVDLISNSSVLLLQLEIPIRTVQSAAEIGHQAGTTVILNPAPAAKLPESLYQYVDYLTPNETEAEQLTGIRVSDTTEAEEAAAWFFEKGVGTVIFTLGKRGALLVSPDTTREFIAPSVTAVDTTAAGDAFNGALAARLSEGAPIEDSISFANTVAACSVTRPGAQPSMPDRKELAAFSKHLSLELSP